MAQLVRAPPCHGGGRGFESRLGRFKWDLSSAGRASALQAEGHRFKSCPRNSNAQLAQLVEQRTENPRVSGSIPELGILRKPEKWDISSVGRALDF